MTMMSFSAPPPVAHAIGRLGERARDLIRYWLVFSACLGLLIFRGWDRLTHPELFAEGVRFMGQVLNDGWWTLVAMQDQALHVAPKLVAILAINLAPVDDIPAFTNLACYAATAAVMASLSRPCYRWLIPSDAARVVLSMLLTLAPGLTEILGNLAGLHWSLLLWLGLLTLKNPKHPLTLWELVIAALTLTSSAGAVVYLPIALLRLVLARGRHAVPPYRPALGLSRVTGELILFTMLFLTAAFLMSSFFMQEKKVALETLDIYGALRGLDALLPSLGALFTTFYFLHPFLGTENTSLFFVAMPFYPLVAVSLVVVSILLCRLWRDGDYRFWLIPTWLGCLMGLAIMLSVVRYWAFYGIFSFPYWDWWARYNFVFACTGLVLWFILLRPQSLHRLTHWSTIVALALVVGYTSQANTVTTRAKPPHDEDGFAVKRYGDRRYWSQSAAELKESIETGCPAEVKVRSYPHGKWRFVYQSPLTAAECEETEQDSSRE